MAIQSRESFQNDKNAEQATVIAFEELEKNIIGYFHKTCICE